MVAAQVPTRINEELADLFASNPTPEQVLAFRPSEALQQRSRELLAKLSAGPLSAEEHRELDQFDNAEQFMRLVKARLHAKKAAHP